MSNKQDKQLKITNQNKDVLFKKLFDLFPYILLSIFKFGFGSNSKYVQVPSELATIESYQGLPDKVFLVDDCKILAIEFDSSGKQTDITRYMLYAANLSAKYTLISQSKVFYPVYFYVIYPANVKIPPCDYTTEGNLLFSFVPISIGDIIDGNEILAKMIQNLASDPNYIPSDEDSIKLVLAVFGKVKGKRKTFYRKVGRLAGSLYSNKPDQKDKLAVLAGALIKFFSITELGSLLGLGDSSMAEILDLLSEGKYSLYKKSYDESEAAIKAAERKAAEFKAMFTEFAKENAEFKAMFTEIAKENAELKAEVAELKAAKESTELKGRDS
ncbi:MAG: cell envelope integrity protein TolA [Deltaproteobacteria bacterium]|jgi:predicted RNA-binding protein with RPS1 domain|nr:cell envelope integrity protein TolA [Deltaproteobacteria bacterium]